MNAGDGNFRFSPLFLIDKIAIQLVRLRKSQRLAIFLKLNLKKRPDFGKMLRVFFSASPLTVHKENLQVQIRNDGEWSQNRCI